MNCCKNQVWPIAKRIRGFVKKDLGIKASRGLKVDWVQKEQGFGSIRGAEQGFVQQKKSDPKLQGESSTMSPQKSGCRREERKALVWSTDRRGKAYSRGGAAGEVCVPLQKEMSWGRKKMKTRARSWYEFLPKMKRVEAKGFVLNQRAGAASLSSFWREPVWGLPCRSTGETCFSWGGFMHDTSSCDDILIT